MKSRGSLSSTVLQAIERATLDAPPVLCLRMRSIARVLVRGALASAEMASPRSPRGYGEGAGASEEEYPSRFVTIEFRLPSSSSASASKKRKEKAETVLRQVELELPAPLSALSREDTLDDWVSALERAGVRVEWEVASEARDRRERLQRFWDSRGVEQGQVEMVEKLFAPSAAAAEEGADETGAEVAEYDCDEEAGAEPMPTPAPVAADHASSSSKTPRSVQGQLMRPRTPSSPQQQARLRERGAGDQDAPAQVKSAASRFQRRRVSANAVALVSGPARLAPAAHAAVIACNATAPVQPARRERRPR